MPAFFATLGLAFLLSSARLGLPLAGLLGLGPVRQLGRRHLPALEGRQLGLQGGDPSGPLGCELDDLGSRGPALRHEPADRVGQIEGCDGSDGAWWPSARSPPWEGRSSSRSSPEASHPGRLRLRGSPDDLGPLACPSVFAPHRMLWTRWAVSVEASSLGQLHDLGCGQLRILGEDELGHLARGLARPFAAGAATFGAGAAFTAGLAFFATFAAERICQTYFSVSVMPAALPLATTSLASIVFGWPEDELRLGLGLLGGGLPGRGSSSRGSSCGASGSPWAWGRSLGHWRPCERGAGGEHLRGAAATGSVQD